MGEVISFSAACRARSIKRAAEKVRKEEEKNRQQAPQPKPAVTGSTKLSEALQKFGSFTGNQLKKKKENHGDVQT